MSLEYILERKENKFIGGRGHWHSMMMMMMTKNCLIYLKELHSMSFLFRRRNALPPIVTLLLFSFCGVLCRSPYGAPLPFFLWLLFRKATAAVLLPCASGLLKWGQYWAIPSSRRSSIHRGFRYAKHQPSLWQHQNLVRYELVLYVLKIEFCSISMRTTFGRFYLKKTQHYSSSCSSPAASVEYQRLLFKRQRVGGHGRLGYLEMYFCVQN